MRSFARLAILIVLLLSVGKPLMAACTTPTGTAGDQFYNTSYNVMQFCNGTSWVNMGSIGPGSYGSIGTLTSGDFCTTDGTLINCTSAAVSLTTQASGTLQAAQFPALTGDVTTSAGSLATTVAKINSVALGTTTATAGNLLIGSGSAWVTNAMSGDVTITSGGVTTIGAAKVTVAKISATGTPSSSTYLRGDGSWTAPPAGVGGSTTQVQYNSAGTISGDSGFTYAGSGAITFTTSLTGPLHIGGTAASSTLTLESTSGTGTSDAIIFKTGSQAEAMRINTSGSVGIGTASPTDLLDVYGALRFTNGLAYDATKPGRLYKGTVTGLTLHGVTGSSYDFGIYTPGGTALVENPTGTTNVVLVRGGGYVGIGTASPNYQLEVNGATGIGLTDGGGTTYDSVITHSASSPWRIFTLNSKAGTGGWRGAINFDTNYNAGTTFTAMTVRANTDGTTANVGIGTTSPTNVLHLYSGDTTDRSMTIGPGASSANGLNIGYGGASYGAGISFLNAHSSGGSSGQFYFTTDAVTRMVISSSGNVGIGTATPGASTKLNVNGRGLFTGGSNDPGDSTAAGVAIAYDGTYGLIDAVQTGIAGKPLKINPSQGSTLINPAGGNVGIGTTPSALFDAKTATNRHIAIRDWSSTAQLLAMTDGAASYANMLLDGNAVFINSSSGGNVGIGTTTAGTILTVNGTVTATNLLLTSDARKKKDIQPLQIDALDAVKKLQPVTYYWKEIKDSGSKGQQIGFIAQDVEKIVPQAVVTADDADKSKALKYDELIPILVKAVQDLSKQNEQLAHDNKKLQEDIQAIRLQLDAKK